MIRYSGTGLGLSCVAAVVNGDGEAAGAAVALRVVAVAAGFATPAAEKCSVVHVDPALRRADMTGYCAGGVSFCGAGAGWTLVIIRMVERLGELDCDCEPREADVAAALAEPLPFEAGCA
jgi:hypothetical protein